MLVPVLDGWHALRPWHSLCPILSPRNALLRSMSEGRTVPLQEEEALWTEIIERYGGLDANWVPDLVGRAW